VISQASLYRRMEIFDVDVDWRLGKSILNYPCVRIPDSIQSIAYNWCQERFDENWIWSSPIQTDYTDIYFLHEDDAIMFKLTFATT
jgi:hypothetical protein